MADRIPTHKPRAVPSRREGDRAYARTRGPDIRDTAAWQKVRALKIARDPLCEECKAHGVTRVADEVHHVEPVERRPDLALSLPNLRSLCRTCHAKESAKERVRGAVTDYVYVARRAQ